MHFALLGLACFVLIARAHRPADVPLEIQVGPRHLQKKHTLQRFHRHAQTGNATSLISEASRGAHSARSHAAHGGHKDIPDKTILKKARSVSKAIAKKTVTKLKTADAAKEPGKAHPVYHCDDEPPDKVHLAWTDVKLNWCCEKKGLGCPPIEINEAASLHQCEVDKCRESGEYSSSCCVQQSSGTCSPGYHYIFGSTCGEGLSSMCCTKHSIPEANCDASKCLKNKAPDAKCCAKPTTASCQGSFKVLYGSGCDEDDPAARQIFCCQPHGPEDSKDDDDGPVLEEHVPQEKAQNPLANEITEALRPEDRLKFEVEQKELQVEPGTDKEDSKDDDDGPVLEENVPQVQVPHMNPDNIAECIVDGCKPDGTCCAKKDDSSCTSGNAVFGTSCSAHGDKFSLCCTVKHAQNNCDASKCLRNGNPDDRCCAPPGEANCSDGFAMMFGTRGACREGEKHIFCCKDETPEVTREDIPPEDESSCIVDRCEHNGAVDPTCCDTKEKAKCGEGYEMTLGTGCKVGNDNMKSICCTSTPPGLYTATNCLKNQEPDEACCALKTEASCSPGLRMKTGASCGDGQVKIFCFGDADEGGPDEDGARQNGSARALELQEPDDDERCQNELCQVNGIPEPSCCGPKEDAECDGAEISFGKECGRPNCDGFSFCCTPEKVKKSEPEMCLEIGEEDDCCAHPKDASCKGGLDMRLGVPCGEEGMRVVFCVEFEPVILEVDHPASGKRKKRRRKNGTASDDRSSYEPCVNSRCMKDGKKDSNCCAIPERASCGDGMFANFGVACGGPCEDRAVCCSRQERPTCEADKCLKNHRADPECCSNPDTEASCRPGYDMLVGQICGMNSWRIFCCQAGHEPGEFNCGENVAEWPTWTDEKKQWCCKETGTVGCANFTVPAAAPKEDGVPQEEVIRGSQTWAAAAVSCEHRKAYECGDMKHCCCRLGCEYNIEEDSCGTCRDDAPMVKQWMIRSSPIWEQRALHGICTGDHMHPCGPGCCCNAGYKYNMESRLCEAATPEKMQQLASQPRPCDDKPVLMQRSVDNDDRDFVTDQAPPPAPPPVEEEEGLEQGQSLGEQGQSPGEQGQSQGPPPEQQHYNPPRGEEKDSGDGGGGFLGFIPWLFR